jgi:hypothetical protein
LLSEPRIQLLKLPHLAIGPPACVAVPGIPHVKIRDLLEAVRCVEARGEFVGDSYVVDKTARMDRVKCSLAVHCIKIMALKAGNLSADERSAVLKILRAIRRPQQQLLVMLGHNIQVLLPLSGCHGITAGSTG